MTKKRKPPGYHTLVKSSLSEEEFYRIFGNGPVAFTRPGGFPRRIQWGIITCRRQEVASGRRSSASLLASSAWCKHSNGKPLLFKTEEEARRMTEEFNERRSPNISYVAARYR